MVLKVQKRQRDELLYLEAVGRYFWGLIGNPLLLSSLVNLQNILENSFSFRRETIFQTNIPRNFTVRIGFPRAKTLPRWSRPYNNRLSV
jgi:hypothetical protein